MSVELYEQITRQAQRCARLSAMLDALKKDNGRFSIGVYGAKRASGTVDIDYDDATSVKSFRESVHQLLDAQHEALAVLTSKLDTPEAEEGMMRLRLPVDCSLDVLELPTRMINVCEAHDIRTVNELLCWTRLDLSELPNCGARTLDDLEWRLLDARLRLRPTGDGWNDGYANSRQRQLAYRASMNPEGGSEQDGDHW